MSVSIRDATVEEIERLVRLQPRWDLRCEARFIVAEAHSPARIVGGMVLGILRPNEDRSIGLVDLVIFPRFRETDVIEQMALTAIEHFQAQGISGLELMSPLPEGSLELGIFQRLGFAEDRRLICYEFSVAALAARSRSTYERLVRQRGIPSGAETVPLAPRYWRDVVQLLLAEKLIDVPKLKEIERTGLSSYFNPSSRILLLDGQFKGVILAQVQGHYSEVMDMAIAPELRSGAAWANALLILRSTEIGAALGQEIVVMWADPVRHPMTTRLARRMGSSPKAAKVFLQKN